MADMGDSLEKADMGDSLEKAPPQVTLDPGLALQPHSVRYRDG